MQRINQTQIHLKSVTKPEVLIVIIRDKLQGILFNIVSSLPTTLPFNKY